MEIKPAYVTFEQAKLLKEKGIDINCRLYYNNGIYINTGSEIGQLHSFINGQPNKNHPLICLVPKQWQVVEWLRVKHGIWISVDCDCYGGLWYSKLSVASEKNWDNLNKRHTIVSAFHKFNNEHKSPEEATSAAIDYILKELI